MRKLWDPPPAGPISPAEKVETIRKSDNQQGHYKAAFAKCTSVPTTLSGIVPFLVQQQKGQAEAEDHEDAGKASSPP